MVSPPFYWISFSWDYWGHVFTHVVNIYILRRTYPPVVTCSHTYTHILTLSVWVSYCTGANYHKLSAFKQCNFITLSFWRSEMWSVSPWDKLKVFAELCSFWGLQESALSFLSSFYTCRRSLANGFILLSWKHATSGPVLATLLSLQFCIFCFLFHFLGPLWTQRAHLDNTE